jgi:hypothetical protein
MVMSAWNVTVSVGSPLQPPPVTTAFDIPATPKSAAVQLEMDLPFSAARGVMHRSGPFGLTTWAPAPAPLPSNAIDAASSDSATRERLLDEGDDRREEEETVIRPPFVADAALLTRSSTTAVARRTASSGSKSDGFVKRRRGAVSARTLPRDSPQCAP